MFKKEAADAIECKVIEKLGVIAKRKSETLELRYISWNGKPAKYDIRPWYVDEEGNEQCRKGITLTGEEVETLYNILKKEAEDGSENNS